MDPSAMDLCPDHQTILDKLRNLGVDGPRLKKCLDSKDNWGGMVHAFEYLTVCGVVEAAFANETEQDDADYGPPLDGFGR